MNGVFGLTVAFLTTTAFAQTTLVVGQDALACPNGGGAKRLAAASAAMSGEVAFAYDPATALLRVTVSNTSPWQPGDAEQLLTGIWFSAPFATITDADVVGQTGASQHPFRLSFDADCAKNQNRAGCFGSFPFELVVTDLRDSIKNPVSQSTGSTNRTAIAGPVEFTIQLAGPEVRGLSSAAFGAASSRGGTHDVNVALRFETRNTGGSTLLANGDSCRTAVFLRGTPRLGEHVQICVEGSNNCFAWLLASDTPGPTQVFGFTLPIGLPLINHFPLGWFTPGTYELSLPITIPHLQTLIGIDFYFTNATYPWGQPSLLSFSEAYEVTVF